MPSCPILYPPVMTLLDELGIDERTDADDTAKIEEFGFEFGSFTTSMRLPEMFGRAYAMGIDRASFDELLWKNLERFPSVTARDGTTATDLLRDEEGRVTGVSCIDADGAQRSAPRELISTRRHQPRAASASASPPSLSGRGLPRPRMAAARSACGDVVRERLRGPDEDASALQRRAPL